MGVAGSEVAIEAADIALVEDSLTGVLYVRDLSNETLRIVNQNFAIATSTNVIGVVAGALGLMGPVAAGMLHIVHTLGILANSGRLLNYQGEIQGQTYQAQHYSQLNISADPSQPKSSI
ncbi:MAG: hypothetical protein ACYDHC_10700 [Desulfuromonadaceae bacterium]